MDIKESFKSEIIAVLKNEIEGIENQSKIDLLHSIAYKKEKIWTDFDLDINKVRTLERLIKEIQQIKTNPDSTTLEIIKKLEKEEFNNNAGYLNNFIPFIELKKLLGLEINKLKNMENFLGKYCKEAGIQFKTNIIDDIFVSQEAGTDYFNFFTYYKNENLFCKIESCELRNQVIGQFLIPDTYEKFKLVLETLVNV